MPPFAAFIFGGIVACWLIAAVRSYLIGRRVDIDGAVYRAERDTCAFDAVDREWQELQAQHGWEQGK